MIFSILTSIALIGVLIALVAGMLAIRDFLCLMRLNAELMRGAAGPADRRNVSRDRLEADASRRRKRALLSMMYCLLAILGSAAITLIRNYLSPA